MRQKASIEKDLQNRLSFLSDKGIKPPKTDKDTLVRKLQADIRAVNKRLRAIAAYEKRPEEMAKPKAEKVAAPQKVQEGGKVEKPKKALEEGKGKKTKPEMNTASPGVPEGGKSQKTTISPGEGEATKE
jgi:hypothetical protein